MVQALVTGGAGFIGSHLVKKLVEAGWETTVFDRRADTASSFSPDVRIIAEDLSNRGALQEALSGVDVAYHLAWSGVHRSSNQDLRAHVEINLLPTLSFLESCREQQVKRVVFLSSGGAVYGVARTLPMSEEHPTHPISAYGATKLATEAYLELYGHLHDLDYVILRPSVPYGEGQNSRGNQGAVAVFLGKVQRGEPITIWGDGEIVRDFFHVSDLAHACLLAGDLGVKRGVYNIGGGAPVTLKNLLEMILKVTGERVPVVYEPPRLFDPPAIVLDIDKAWHNLGWKPIVHLPDGISRTWRWMQEMGD